MNPSAESDDRPLPVGWLCRQSKSRRKHYYFNTVTGESSWKHPLDIDLLSTHVSVRPNIVIIINIVHTAISVTVSVIRPQADVSNLLIIYQTLLWFSPPQKINHRGKCLWYLAILWYS